MIECAYVLEDYPALEQFILQLPSGSGMWLASITHTYIYMFIASDAYFVFYRPFSDLLSDVGDKLMSVGLCSEAVRAFLKGQNVKSAIDCCVLLNQV